MKLPANLISLFLFFTAGMAAAPEDRAPDPAQAAQSGEPKPEPAAQPLLPAPPVDPAYSGERISLELKDADLKDFFQLIGDVSSLNIVLDPDVEGSLTLFLKDVPWDQALDVALKQQRMGRRLSGNVLRIATLSTLEAEHQQQQPLAQPSLPAASTDTHVLRVPEQDDQIIAVRTKIRHTTVLILPSTETILDFVVGDSEYWALTGSANVAYIKPLAQGLDTNVTLVCSSGRIYPFLVTVASPPHLVVRIERSAKKHSDQLARPAFVARSQVKGYQLAAQQAAEQAAAASEHARKQVETAEQNADSTMAQFRAHYPTTLQWPYRLERTAFQDPFLVEAMWRDDRFTYLRSHAQETPALYELRDGKPSLVAYDLEEDGLFVVRRLLSDGWLQVGDKKAKWRVVANEP